MSKKEDIKKYNLSHKGLYKEVRDYDHPFSKDDSEYDKLGFYIVLTKFEHENEHYGLHGYETPLMSFNEALYIHKEIGADWDRPGRRTWNSINIIGIDNTGKTFSPSSKFIY